tara:strand:+ start:789 stop:1304 length:516 start_codon:yes stop_codon:yes gene_type:complete
MAKNTFLIRARVNAENAGAFKQNDIDLGSYTNLGSSKPEVLRIHRMHISITDADGEVPTMTADTCTTLAWQLTTQSQSGLVTPVNDSYLSGGRASVRNPDSATNPPSQAFEEQILAQDFTNGVLVAVPTLYLGGFAGSDFTEDVYFSIILECSTEAMTKANAVALAVSQYD